MSNITDIGYIENISTDISDIFIPEMDITKWVDLERTLLAWGETE